jgi:hypothetical protein
LWAEKSADVKKSFWQAIVDYDYAIPYGHSVADLTPVLIELLGSTDIEVRDPFAYMILAHWIVRDKCYTPDALRGMAAQLVQNLSVGLGEKDTNTIFRRSFSMLILSLILYRDNQEPFLSENEVDNLLHWTLEYFAAEQDLRGYVPKKGWAHSVAHTADAFKSFARNRHLDAADLESILTAIADKMMLPVSTVYIHGEDERLAAAILEILKRGLLDWSAWDAWLERFFAWKNGWEEGDFIPTIHAPWYNSKCLLRSFFFRQELSPNLPPPAPELRHRLLEVIKLYGH